MKYNLLTVASVAVHFNISHRKVLYAIRTGKLKATKMGWVWVIKRSDLPDVWFGGVTGESVRDCVGQ